MTVEPGSRRRPVEVQAWPNRDVELTLLSWNVARRRTRMAEQAALVAATAVDVVCLQEVTASTAQRWSETLIAGGWPHIAIGAAPAERRRSAPRLLSVLTAARRPFAASAVEGVPWPERALAAQLDEIELINLHSPISPSPGLAKVLTHEAVRDHLAAGTGPRAVCGDFNTPRREHPDGRVWTFARTRSGKLRPERGERWERAELALLRGLATDGFRDAFRARHGLEVVERSWEWQDSGGGYRLDHLVVSAEIHPEEILYLHEWRRAGLSDHSPLLARITWHSHEHRRRVGHGSRRSDRLLTLGSDDAAPRRSGPPVLPGGS